uniref:UDP-N-acetylglucosamine transporter n=1 Tax=Plectus sambesii TaxID=2011161 RepID=A0A914VQC9_9BILA
MAADTNSGNGGDWSSVGRRQSARESFSSTGGAYRRRASAIVSTQNAAAVVQLANLGKNMRIEVQRHQPPPTKANNNLKWMSLVVLIVQTTALVLVLRYSRTQKTEGPKYISSTAVLVSEIVKFFSCIIVLLAQHKWSFAAFTAEMDAENLQKPMDTLKVAVPALLYVVQNNLLFLALTKLDAATYQVTYQLKILTTAFFSVSMLGRRLNGLKWVALILLTLGVALVQLPSGSAKPVEKVVETSWLSGLGDSDKMIGLVSVLAACFSSGFSGVYFEKILKGSNTSLWMRNLQLAFFSIFGGFFMVYVYDSAAISENGFFQGYSFLIWIVVVLQAYGGLVIALVVKYADNILKGFAVSLSIILSSIMSYWLLGDFQPSLAFLLGATVVIASTFLYGYEPQRPDLKPM